MIDYFVHREHLFGSGSKGGSPEKNSCSIQFLQMRGGGALPKVFVHFSQTVYLGSI